MSKKSKDIIANSLIELMKNNSFNEITISEICDNTCLVRKTFYNNFTSKENIIEYIVQKLVAEYLKMVKKDNSFSLKKMSYLFFCFGKKHKKILSMLIDNTECRKTPCFAIMKHGVLHRF